MSSSKRVQRDRATPTLYIPSRFINSRLNAQYLPSYRFDKKSYMSFRLVPISVTLDDLERRNGPYFALFFTEFDNGPYFVSFNRIRVRCHPKTLLLGLPVFQNLL